MGVWTVCYCNLETMKNEWTIFDHMDDLKEFLEEYEIEIKKKFPLNRLNESVSVYPPNAEVYPTDILKGKYNLARY